MRQRSRRWLAAITALWLLSGVPVAGAVTDAQQADFSSAQYVQVTLGLPNVEVGLRLVEGQPDGQNEALAQGTGRRSLPGVGGDRFFYFDVHDTYVRGGINQIIMTVTYLDNGLTPIYLEYDSLDPNRPRAMTDEVVKKRIPIVTRGNTEALRTERISLEDARFGNNQPGGADFRVGSTEQLVLTNLSVFRLSHKEILPDIRVVLDGMEVTFDVPPYLDPVTNRTLVPMRAMLNALGIPDSDIAWDGVARRVQARKDQITLMLAIDAAVALVNDTPMVLDQPAVIRADRTLVPLRFVADQFGLGVNWDGAKRLITLTTLSTQPKL